MGLLGRRNREDELVEGEPSALGRARQDDNGRADGPPDAVDPAQPAGGAARADARPSQADPDVTAPVPEGVREQLEPLAAQIRALQQQVEELVARRSDAVAGQASERVAAIVQAAEQSAAEISAQAYQEGAELRERLRAEAEAEADRIRVEAQADASKIRTEAHAAAARLREETLAEVRREVERITDQLAEELRVGARVAIDEVAGSASPVPPVDTPDQPETPAVIETEEVASAEVEEAVDELQSAAAVLEESLRHLQQIGQGLTEAE